MRQSLSQYLGVEEVEEDTPLADTSLNSNAVVVLCQSLVDKLQVPRLSRTLIFDHPVTAAILNHIRTQVSDTSISYPCSSRIDKASAALTREIGMIGTYMVEEAMIEHTGFSKALIPETKPVVDGLICCSGEALQLLFGPQPCGQHTCKALVVVQEDLQH